MPKRSAGIGSGTVFTALALVISGCGNPQGAGTVDMAAVKKAAVERGIPEAKEPVTLKSKTGQSAARQETAPKKALPKGGR